MSNPWRVSLLLAALLLRPPSLTGAARLALQVTPTVSVEPAYVTVRVRVDPNPSNRFLEVVAESPDFRRSSEISLDGQHAPHLNVFDFQALPMGIYDVSSTLIEQSGARTTVTRVLVVASGAGGGARR